MNHTLFFIIGILIGLLVGITMMCMLHMSKAEEIMEDYYSDDE